MDNQHKKIKGYRDLNQSEIDGMNSVKAAEEDVGQLWQQIKLIPNVDQRALAHARTQLQDGFSWFVRAIAQPHDPFTAPFIEQTYMDRLQIEHEELTNKITKLSQFRDGTAFSTLAPDVQLELSEQLEHMLDYCNVLKRRIHRQENPTPVL